MREVSTISGAGAGLLHLPRPFTASVEDAVQNDSTAQEVWASAELLEATRNGVEIWRPVVGGDGWYDVSNMGGVRTYRKRGSRTSGRIEPVPMAPAPIMGGYLAVTLTVNGKAKCGLVNVLVAEAFIGQRPGSYRFWQAGHHDDNKHNNRLTNIRWCTALVNSADKIRNGRTLSYRRKEQVIDGVRHFRCTGPCGQWKPETYFRPIKTTAGRSSQCIPCGRARENELKRARTIARGAKPRKRRTAA